MANRIVSDTLIAKFRYLLEYMGTRQGVKDAYLLSLALTLFIVIAFNDTRFVFEHSGAYLYARFTLLCMLYIVLSGLVLTVAVLVQQLLEYYLTNKYAPQTEHVSQSTTVHEDERSP